MKKKVSKKYSGMTFVEMIMAIAIFTIGMEGFTLLFARTWKINSYTLEMGQSTMAVSQGLNKMVDYIRRARQGDDGAFPVKLADDDELTFFCDYDKDGITERIHLYKNNTNIRMGVTNPTATLPKTYPAGDQEDYLIVSDIVNNISTPIFYYFNKDYPADTTNNPLTTPAHLIDVKMAKVYLEINIDPGRGPENVKIQSFVALRNLNEYDHL